MSVRQTITIRGLTRLFWGVALNVLALWCVVAFVRSAQTVIAWILVAALVAVALEPAVAALERRGASHAVAVLAVVLAAFSAIAALLTAFVPLAFEQARSLVASAPEWLERVSRSGWVERADRHFDLVARAQGELRRHGTALAVPVFGLVASVLKAILATIAVSVLAVFMLLFGGRVVHDALEWVDPAGRDPWLSLAREVRAKVGGFVAGTFIIAAIGGAPWSAATLALGVPYFPALGAMYAVLGLIPFVGSTLAALVIAVATLATVGSTRAVIVTVAFVIYQQIENHVLQPLVQQRTIRMNPLLIVLAVLTATAVFGILGAVLALPAAGAAQVLLG